MIDRRSFLATTSTALLSVAAGPLVRRRADHDLIVRNGTLFDGLGAEGRELDLAISAGRIVEIGPRLGSRGKEEIDARGLAVAPGFIDIHSHGDSNLNEDARAESVIRQGV
ncbi:MAG: D-aminoacylase, partial [bacterium]